MQPVPDTLVDAAAESLLSVSDGIARTIGRTRRAVLTEVSKPCSYRELYGARESDPYPAWKELARLMRAATDVFAKDRSEGSTGLASFVQAHASLGNSLDDLKSKDPARIRSSRLFALALDALEDRFGKDFEGA